jgi:chitodextrinase
MEVFINLPNAADSGLEVLLTLNTTLYPGYTLDKTKVTFAAGEQIGTFRIISTWNRTQPLPANNTAFIVYSTLLVPNATNNASTNGTSNSTNSTSGNATSSNTTAASATNTTNITQIAALTGLVKLSLGGADAGVFALSSTQVAFNLLDEDIIVPLITTFKATVVTQISATFQLQASEIVYVYWMIALKGTEPPPFVEVRSQGPPPSLSTLSRYGKLITSATGAITFTITGLMAETDYDVFLYVEDRAGNYNGGMTLNCTTLARPNAASVVLRFLKQNMTENEELVVRQYVAFYLAYPPYKYPLCRQFLG